MPNEKLLFLTLNTFSTTGGIEKVCRIAGKALHEIAAAQQRDFLLYSLNDSPVQADERYMPAATFRGFSGNKRRFVTAAIRNGRQSKTVVLSHIHLLLVGMAIKLFSPSTKVILIAHGIEVWKPLPKWKTALLKKLDLILPVSQFTKEKMISLYGLKKERLAVVNNCLDPYLQRQADAATLAAFRKKYGIEPGDTVLLTLARLKSSEQYKGYDRVITALPQVLEQFPNLKYFIAGKYDAEEKARLDALIQRHGVGNAVLFPGFLPDAEVDACFETCTLYVMPSTGEGFGIVFVEAQFYGKPVIGGNADGSVDALAQGHLGLLVNPTDIKEIAEAIKKVLSNPVRYTPHLKEVQARFGYPTYVENLQKALAQQP